MKIQLTGFAGENRALHPKILPESIGVASVNQKPGRGDFRAWREPLTVQTIPSGRKTIYRMGRDVASNDLYWLSWPTRVKAVRGFEDSDAGERTYYTGDGVPKVTDNTMALAGSPVPVSNYPAAARPLGLPAPTTPLGAAADPGTGTGLDNSYYYVYTYTNDWGWESGPSPVSAELIRPLDATATITGFVVPPAGNYGINRMRLYRTQQGASGSAAFFFLRELTIGTTTTTDDNRPLGEVLPTVGWDMPPADMSELTALWGGMMAGISGNSVRLCEPYTPYAWPPAYDLVPPDATPVALGVFGQALVILTTNRPLLASGSSPESMDQAPLEMSQGCVSAASVVSMGMGVAWASEDGLCWFGANGPKIITAGVMTREDWQALKPTTIIGQMYEGLYFGSYDDGGGRKGFFVDPSGESPGIFFLNDGYEALFFDELQDQLFVLDGSTVKRWDSGATKMAARFRSKVFQVAGAASFNCAQVVADEYPVTLRIMARGMVAPTVSAVLAAQDQLAALDADGVQYAVTIADRDAVRLPSGFAAPDWQLEVQATTPIQAVSLATNMMELRG